MPALDFTLSDQAGRPWSLTDHLDAAVVLLFLRGDWCTYCNGQLVSMAHRYQEFLDAGGRVVGISVDPPEQNSAMIDKLRLPFPLLSDPDRSAAIETYGASDPKDPRMIALPTVVIIGPDGEEAYRHQSRDYADRPPEDDVLAALRSLGLPATTQEPPELGPIEPGPKAMPFDHLFPYYRGARFAIIAMAQRHPSTRDEADRYVAQLDRYSEAVKAVYRTKQGG